MFELFSLCIEPRIVCASIVFAILSIEIIANLDISSLEKVCSCTIITILESRLSVVQMGEATAWMQTKYETINNSYISPCPANKILYRNE